VNGFVDGGWRTGYDETGDSGGFERQETTFRSRVRDDSDADYPPRRGGITSTQAEQAECLGA
jgi:putative glutathione S-transferase